MIQRPRLAGPDDPFVSRTDIDAAIADMASYYNEVYRDTPRIVGLTVLNGGEPFADELLPQLTPTVKRDEIKVRSMNGVESTGELVFDREPELDLTGEDVLLVEDLVDTGLTISGLARYVLDKRQARSLRIAALFEKPEECRKTELPKGVDIRTGIPVANVFIVGFGLDWAGYYRELNYLTTAVETAPGFFEPAVTIEKGAPTLVPPITSFLTPGLF